MGELEKPFLIKSDRKDKKTENQCQNVSCEEKNY